jgi:hypothetical protein
MSALRVLAETLDRLDLEFLVGGSLASSAHGVLRATLDVDLVIRIHPRQVKTLADALGPDWYADVEQARELISRGRAFNIIHRATGLKFDLFPAYQDFHDAQLRRAQLQPIHFEGEPVTCPVSTAEDILLAKLRWYADGGEVSERQWRDIFGILATNPKLDFEYINVWAARLGVSRLLAKALSEQTAD